MLVVLLTAFGLVGIEPASRAASVSQVTPAATSVSSSELSLQLARTVEDQVGTYGLVVDAVDAGEQVAIGADHRFRAASVYKVLVAYAVLREVEQRRLSLDEPLVLTEADYVEAEPASGLAPDQTVTVRECLAAMLTASSNLAAHRLLRLVGRANLNHLLAGLGMRATRVPLLEELSPWPDDGPAPDAATTTPQEMAGFLRQLLRGNLLGQAERQELARWLRAPEELDPVVVGLPDGVEVFIKLGELEDAANVAGWVMTREGPVVLAIFSEDTDPGSARETIAHLASQVYKHFDR